MCDCVRIHPDNADIKFANDTTVVGLISVDNETVYRDEVQGLVGWCADQASTVFLAVHMDRDLQWSFNTSDVMKKAPQHLHFEDPQEDQPEEAAADHLPQLLH